MKKKLFALGAAAVLALGLASCAGGNIPGLSSSGSANGSTNGGSNGGSNVIKLEYSGTASNKEFNMSLFEDFKAARKAAGDTHTYEISYVEHGPDLVDSEVQDWIVGPDVFEFASDKITGLYSKGALAKITGKNADFIIENNTELGCELSKFNDDYYAYPYTGDNTYYLQYDKSFFTEEDVKSIETMLEKANESGKKIGYSLKTAFWGAGALFTYGADYKMSYTEDGSVNKIEADFDSEKGLKAAKAIYKVIKSGAWQDAMEGPTPTNNLVACVAGTWDIKAYKEALGDNYACAPMPTITIDGDTKNLGAFLGGKLLGVNPQRSQGNLDRLVAAHELAKFLSGKECQLKRYENQGVVPCNKEAAADPKIVADPNTKVLIEQAKFAHVQTAVPDKFWTAPTTLVEGIIAGDYDNADGTGFDPVKLQEAVTTLNNTIKEK